MQSQIKHQNIDEMAGSAYQNQFYEINLN